MKICQSPCHKYERVRAMRRRETGAMHILDKKCNFCLKIKQKWVNLYSIHAAIEFPMFFGAISFMEGCIFEFVEIFSSLCYPSLSRIGKTSLFSKHTQMRASPTFKSSQYVNRCIFVEWSKWKINFVLRPYLHANTNETVCRVPGVGGFSFIFHKVPD